MRNLFSILFLISFTAQAQNSPVLTKKGEWLLYFYKQKYSCRLPISFRVPVEENKNLIINCETCSGINSPEELNDFARKFFNQGLTKTENLNTVTVDTPDDMRYVFSKKKNQLSLEPKESFQISGFKFRLNGNGTYQVKRNDSVYVKQFQPKWFDNCVLKADSMIVVLTKVTSQNKRYLSTECQVAFLSLDKTTEPEKPGAKLFSLICSRDSATFSRALTLFSDSTFHWNWKTHGSRLLCGGKYSIKQDSLLILQWDQKITDYYMEDFQDENPKERVGPKYLINKKYVYRDERIFFINEYMD